MLTRNNGVVSGSGGKISRGRVRPGMMPPPVTPPPSGTETQELIDFRAASLARPESQHTMAGDDAMRREMVLATSDLAPRAGATHVAVQNGNWTDATTWLNASNAFQVPGAGAKILIPRGITVTYDSNASTVYDWLRHDGKLQFVTATDTRLIVDTIVSDHHSEWVQGTEDAPITATSIVEFPGGGDINTVVDTLLLGRGWVSMGKVSIYGAAKRNWATCHQTRAIGDNEITLNEAPTGWQDGDEISIGGTRCRGWVGGGGGGISHLPLDTAHVTITNISGNTITFTPALTTARDLTAVRADPKFADAVYYVGNFTRNVKFRSPPNTPIHRRGHVMFMDPGVEAHNASWDWLGRTRKDLPSPLSGGKPESVDATNDARMDLVYGAGTRPANANVRGRYNLHLHKHGVGAAEKFSNISGCAASYSPGWLYAHHSAYANFTECVGRIFTGVGIMAEVGNEIGRWERCLMMAGSNAPTAETLLDGAWKGRRSSIANEKDIDLRLNGRGELGLHGSAYWGRSRVVEIIDCIASDCDNFAAWMGRTGPIAPPFDDIPLPRQMNGTGNIGSANNPVLVVKGARATACRGGMFVIKSSPNQLHTHRSNLYDFLHVHGVNAVGLDYTGKYTLQNWRFFRDSSLPSGTGTSENRVSPIRLSTGTVDMVFNNTVLRMPGLPTTVEAVSIISGNNATAGPHWDHTFIGLDFPADGRPTFTYGGDNKTYPTTLEERIAKIFLLDSSVIQSRPLTWTPVAEPELVFAINAEREAVSLLLAGDITDSLRIKDRDFYNQGIGPNDGVRASLSTAGAERLLVRNGFWTHSGNNYLLIPDMLTDSIMTSTGDYNIRFLTIVGRLRMSGTDNWAAWLTQNNIQNRGALPQRYVDAINASTWRVYEDEPE
jgi:hypothetical protein